MPLDVCRLQGDGGSRQEHLEAADGTSVFISGQDSSAKVRVAPTSRGAILGNLQSDGIEDILMQGFGKMAFEQLPRDGRHESRVFSQSVLQFRCELPVSAVAEQLGSRRGAV